LSTLIDFLSMLPEIATTACSKDNIKHGFIQAGIIDKEFNRYPVFNKILATCPQQPTLEEYRTVLESFEDFIKIMDEKGHIDEEQYDMRGIRMDKDINGQDVFRTAGIAQESFQCSKCHYPTIVDCSIVSTILTTAHTFLSIFNRIVLKKKNARDTPLTEKLNDFDRIGETYQKITSPCSYSTVQIGGRLWHYVNGRIAWPI
jgi:hypothetical protein